MSRHLMARFRHLQAASSNAQEWDWKHRPNNEPEWRDAGYTPAWDAHVPHGDTSVWYQVRQYSHDLNPGENNFSVHTIGERIPDPRGGSVETYKWHPNVPRDGGGFPLPIGHARTLEEAQNIAGKFHFDNYRTFSDALHDGDYDNLDNFDYGDIFGKQSMRRVAFDWKQDESFNGLGRYRSALENGHVLTVSDNGEHGWHWNLFVPGGDGSKVITHGGGRLWRGLPGAVSAEHLPTFEHARQQAERAYRELYPIGTDTGPHDSGVDYSDLGKFMGEL